MGMNFQGITEIRVVGLCGTLITEASKPTAGVDVTRQGDFYIALTFERGIELWLKPCRGSKQASGEILIRAASHVPIFLMDCHGMHIRSNGAQYPMSDDCRVDV